jgi:hypothetical protein
LCQEDQWIVGSRAGFDFENLRDMGENAADGTMDLGHAAKAIGILHARIVGYVGVADFAAGQDLRKIGSGSDLASVWARQVNARVEGYGGTHECFERHGSSEVSDLSEAVRVHDAQRSYPGHGLGAIEQGQTLLGREGERSKAGCGEDFCARLPDALKNGFAFADDDQREMRERSQIATRSYRAFGGDDRVDPCIEHGHEQVNELRPHTTVSLGEDIGAQQEHSPRLSFAERLAEAAGVAANQVGLELGQTVGGNAHIGQLAKSGVDAVNGLASFEDGLNDLTALDNADKGFRSDGNRSKPGRYRFDFRERKWLAV